MRKLRIYHFIGVIGFIIILSRIDISKVFYTLHHVRLDFFLLAFVAALTIPIVKAMRWQALLKIYNVNCRLKHVLTTYLIGTFLAAITPGKVGDLSRVYYLKKIYAVDVTTGQLFANVIIDRLFEMICVGIVCFSGMAFYFSAYFFPIFFAIIILMLSIILMYKFRHSMIRPVEVVLEKLENIFPKISLKVHFEEVIEGLRVLRTARVIVPLFYNIIAYSIFYITIILIAYALRIKMPFYYLMTGMSAAMIFSSIPISIAGLGVREATLLFFFSPLAIKNEIIMSLSLLYFMLCLILPGLIGLIPFLSQPPDIRKTLSDAKEGEIY